MKRNRNLVIIVLASILVGALASIGTLQYAQVVAYGGADPNAAAESVRNVRFSPFRLRWSSTLGIVKTPVETAQDEEMRGAAPEAIVEPVSEDCAQTANAKRRAACNSGTEMTNETAR